MKGDDAAFARAEGPHWEDYPGQTGLTKREYFAGQILQGLMANPERYKYVVGQMSLDNIEPWGQEDATRHNAEKAVYLADALLKALSNEAES